MPNMRAFETGTVINFEYVDAQQKRDRWTMTVAKFEKQTLVKGTAHSVGGEEGYRCFRVDRIVAETLEIVTIDAETSDLPF